MTVNTVIQTTSSFNDYYQGVMGNGSQYPGCEADGQQHKCFKAVC
ncbi:hypothetical protein [Halobacillus mangrovi]|nr:hypothetical protein [Halobacillus mangrovi]